MPDSEAFDAIITGIRFHDYDRFNPSGHKFLIAQVHTSAIVKGNLDHPVLGERYRFWGNWQQSKKYNNLEFNFFSHELLIEQTAGGIESFLVRFIHGIGERKAKAICEQFGSDVVRVLRETPERLSEIDGINEIIIGCVRSALARSNIDPAAYAELVDMFKNYKISKKIIDRLMEYWNSDAPRIIRENPYILLDFPRIGWKTVDELALSLKYEPTGIGRHKAAILEALKRLGGQGHTYGDRVDIECQTTSLLGMKVKQEAFDLLCEEKLIYLCEPEHGLPTYAAAAAWEAEEMIAKQLHVLSECDWPLEFDLDCPDLEDEQITALRSIENNIVSIVTGGAGCGKTWTVTSITKELLRHEIAPIRYVAPTGRAAKKIKEFLDAKIPGNGIPCTTIHRALSVGFSSAPQGIPENAARFNRGRKKFQFRKNEFDPFIDRCIIMDETSMTDVELMAAFLRAVLPGTLLIFVGDHHQLPSVGPGSVLRDMIAAGVPTAILDKPRRNCGTIVEACHAILNGETPNSDRVFDAEKKKNYRHIECEDMDEIANIIVKLHENTSRNPITDLQVVTAENGRLPIGCANLNRLLSRVLNKTEGKEVEDNEDDERIKFRKGDKVVRTKNEECDLMVEYDENDPDHYSQWEWNGQEWTFIPSFIVNGDLGVVRDVVENHSGRYVVVQFWFPDRLMRLPLGECHLLQAYAMTIHRMQGSGSKYVIVPVHKSFYWNNKTNQGLFNRELLYTGISRAEEVLVTVGQREAIKLAIGRKTVQQRKTRLKRLIEKYSEINNNDI